MARPTSSPARDLRAAALADETATEMAAAAQALALAAGDPGSAEALCTMARHNRILALKLRALQGVTPDRVGLARTF
jgi:hypothetical protein